MNEGEYRKTEEEIACEVIRGEWGVGKEQKAELEAAGYDYDRIRQLIAKILDY